MMSVVMCLTIVFYICALSILHVFLHLANSQVTAWMLFSVHMDGQLVAPLAIFRPWIRLLATPKTSHSNYKWTLKII